MFNGYRTAPSRLSHLRRSGISPARREEGTPLRAQPGDDPARVPTRAALFGSDGAARLNIDLKRRTIYCQLANNSRSKFASAEARRSRCVRQSDPRTAAGKRVRVPLRARESHEPQRVVASCSAGGRARRVTGKGIRTPAATRVRLLLGKQGLRFAADPGLPRT